MKNAFTLIELLVVAAVIVILAGILVPTIGMIRKQAKEIECQSNLSEIGKGIIAWRADHGNNLPGKISYLYSGPSDPLYGTSTKLFLCPFDKNNGGDQFMGRPPNSSWGDLSYLYESSSVSVKNSSYCYEASEAKLDDNAYNWFFGTNTGNITSPPKTWLDGKAYQLTHGTGRLPVAGNPFSVSDMPILRCYCHLDWSKEPWDTKQKKVLNLAWDQRIFWSIPTWEYQAP